MEEYQELLGQGAGQVVDMVSQWGLQVLGALGVLIVGWWLSSRISGTVRRGLERASVLHRSAPAVGREALPYLGSRSFTFL